MTGRLRSNRNLRILLASSLPEIINQRGLHQRRVPPADSNLWMLHDPARQICREGIQTFLIYVHAAAENLSQFVHTKTTAVSALINFIR